MPVIVHCKNGHTLRVKDEAVGKKVRCPQCQTVVVVEDEGGEPDDVPDQKRRTSAGASSKKSRGKSRGKKKAGSGSFVWMMLAGGVGVGLVVVGAVLFLFLRPASQSSTTVAQQQPPPVAAETAPVVAVVPTPQAPPVVANPTSPAPVNPDPQEASPDEEVAKAMPSNPPAPETEKPDVTEPEQPLASAAPSNGVTVWDAGETSGTPAKNLTEKGENWVAVSMEASSPHTFGGDCVVGNGKLWLHIPRDPSAQIRIAAKGESGQDVVLPVKLSGGDSTGPRASQVAEFSGDSVRVTIGNEAGPQAICRVTAGKYWVEFIPQEHAEELTLDVKSKFVVLPTEFGEDEICDADWAMQRNVSTIPLPHENMVLTLEKEDNHMCILTYPSIQQAGELTLGLDGAEGDQSRGASPLANAGTSDNFSSAGNNAPAVSALVTSVSAKFEGNSVFACLLPQKNLWHSEVVTKKYSAPGHYPITGKTLLPGIWRIGARIPGKKGTQFYVSEYPNTNLLFECRQSGTMQCLFYYLFRPVEGETSETLTPLDIYRDTLGDDSEHAYLIDTEKAGRLFHRDTKHRGVCGCVDDMKDVWRKEPYKLATDAAYFTNQLSDCKTIIDHMDVRLHEYEGMTQHLAEVLEQIDALDVSKDASAVQTYLNVVRSSHNGLKASVIVDTSRAYALLEEIETKIHSAANQKISLSELDKQIEKVRDVADKQERQLKKFREIYLTLSKASLNFREKAEDPLKPYVVAIGHDCRRLLRTRGRAE